MNEYNVFRIHMYIYTRPGFSGQHPFIITLPL